MDEDNCMVDVAKFYMEFICDESCGKCSPCRIGTKRMLEILTRITEGNGTMQDLEELEELGASVQANSLCALGQTAANPILSTLKHFRDEYLAHIIDKKCPAKVCKNLMQYAIIQDECFRVERMGFAAVWPRAHSEFACTEVPSSSSSSRSCMVPLPSVMRVRISSIRLVPTRQGEHLPQDSSQINSM